MAKFEEDLERGKEVEKMVLSLIRKKHESAVLIPGKFKPYDLYIPEINTKIEIKYDPMSNETGNIVVEIEMGGKDSGLTTTEADWWIFCDDNVLAYITPKQIMKCIFDCKLTYRVWTGPGDTQPKKAFLVRKNELFEYAAKTVKLNG